MDLNLEGKVFIVAGVSKGIGEGITRAIAGEGGIPVIATQSGEVTGAVVKELRSKGAEIHAIIGDLQEVGNCEKGIDETAARYGQIDGIVNNAGVNDGAGLETGPEAFRAFLRQNLFYYYDLVHYALPYLKRVKTR